MTIQIGNVSVEPGTKSESFLNVSNNPDGSPIGIPLMIFNGNQEGPVLTIDSGVHGDELEPTEAIIKLAGMIDPQKLKGTLVLAPVLNVLAFNAKRRSNPIDNLDMNRIFPGSDNGFLTQRLANAYFKEVMLKSDYIINCHNGGALCGPLDFAGGPPREFGEVSKRGFELAKQTRAKFIQIKEKHTIPGSIMINAAKNGIPAILLELGAHSVRYKERQYWVNECITSFTNVMKYLDMIEGQPELRKQQTVVYFRWFKAQKGGIWFVKKKVGDKVTKGEEIGKIVNPFFGKELEVVKAPFDGVVVGIHAHISYHPGDFGIVAIGEILEEIKR